MSSPTYNLYIEDCIGLANSLCIKSGHTADAMNDTLVSYGIDVDLNTPITWKYYVNLNGDYHPADNPIYITSADTQEQILFSKENLRKHPNTRFVYTLESSEFNALCDAHPDQELLLRGIINPVDPQTAIDAAEGTILYYDQSYVEPQEESLIQRLQDWITMYYERHFVNDHLFTDDSVAPNAIAKMHQFLLLEIINHRQERCKTNEAHSYHIWEYLGSHGYLDKHRGAVNLKQALWLYRNIKWVYGNQAKTETFDALVKNLFTDVGIRLFAYDLIQDQTYLNSTYKPLIDIERININYRNNTSGLTPTSISEITSKLKQAIDGETEWLAEDIERTFYDAEHGSDVRYQTKVIEALVEFPKPVSEISKIDVQMRHWLHYAASGTYHTYIYITETKTGKQMRLTPIEAYALNLYLFSLWMERPLDAIPPLRAHRVLKRVLPTKDELKGLLTKRSISDETLEWVMERIPELHSMPTMQDFNEFIGKLVKGLKDIKMMGDIQENSVMKKDIELIYLAHLENVEYDTGIDLVDLIDGTGVDFSVYRPVEARDLSLKIIQATTGLLLGSSGAAGAMQSAMIAIMRQLSSYNVSFVTNFDDMAPVAAKRATIRVNKIAKLKDSKTEFLEFGRRYDRVRNYIDKGKRTFIVTNPFYNTASSTQKRVGLPAIQYRVPRVSEKVVRYESNRTTVTAYKETP